MKRNTHREFVGLPALKNKHREQLKAFEQWATHEHWIDFHLSHYDWWMFPIDAPSSYGYAYTVYEGDVAELKEDEDFVRNYLRGGELLMCSWGWDMAKREYVPNPQPDQKWANWPIRLYKAAKSLRLFGFPEQFESLRLFANDLMRNGESMEYNGRDLSRLFK